MAFYCGVLACLFWLWRLQRLDTSVRINFEERLQQVLLGFRLTNSREMISVGENSGFGGWSAMEKLAIFE